MRTDFELLEIWRGGDNEAGNELFGRHFDSVCRFYKNKIDGPVEDLVQEVFLACLKGRDRFEGRSSFRTYLFSIARFTLYDFYKTRRRNADLDFTTSSVVDLGASPSEVVARKQEHKLLLKALRAIPLDYQVTLELYYWEGMQGPELGEVLEISPNTVRSRLHRARKAVEAALARLASSPEELETTLDNFDGWARALKAGLSIESAA